MGRYVLMDPGALNYAANTFGTIYMDGQVPGFDGQTVIINAGAEHLDLLYEQFDTAMLVNVLEHVLNGPAILRNLYNCIKPGGILIFSDRWYDMAPLPLAAEKSHIFNEQLNNLFHPIRMKQAIFDQLLSGFDVIREVRDSDIPSFAGHPNERGTVFIGRKKSTPC